MRAELAHVSGCASPPETSLWCLHRLQVPRDVRAITHLSSSTSSRPRRCEVSRLALRWRPPRASCALPLLGTSRVRSCCAYCGYGAHTDRRCNCRCAPAGGVAPSAAPRCRRARQPQRRSRPSVAAIARRRDARCTLAVHAARGTPARARFPSRRPLFLCSYRARRAIVRPAIVRPAPALPATGAPVERVSQSSE